MTEAGLPELDMARVRRWCQQRVPEHARSQVKVECDVAPRQLTIVECRPPWHQDMGAEWTRFPIARLRYTKATRQWSLYWRDRHLRFHLYDRMMPSPRIDDLLREIDRDPTGIFWGQTQAQTWPAGPFPGEVFPRLAADALEQCGASRARPLPLERLREQYPPECAFRGRKNARLRYTVLAAAAVHGGTEPDLPEKVTCQQTDDFWQYAAYAAAAYIHAAASRAGVPLPQACQELDQRPGHPPL